MKWIGALLVITACGGCGWKMAKNYREEEKCLRQLYRILEWIGHELAFRMWPLSVLFRHVAKQTNGQLQQIMNEFSDLLDQQAQPDAYSCMEAVLGRHPSLSDGCRQLLSEMGRSLGRYDLSGQLKEILRIQEETKRVLEQHCAGAGDRLRCYQALGLCAGFVLAIVLL